MNAMPRTTTRMLSIAAGLAASGTAGAHSGHGLGDGSHWHASDAWGLVLGLALAVVALWLLRRK